MDHFILSLDQGTTSSRAIIFNKSGDIISVSQKEFEQIFPKPGWVEHNANEIWETQKAVALDALKKSRIDPKQIAGIGITNQRETTVIWDRATGEPLCNAVVWQCRRSSEICNIFKNDGKERIFRKKTGLVLDPYFSGTKVKWLLDKHPEIRKKAEKGEACFGTIDSWLLYKLTGEHATEPSNASRTLFFNIRKGEWDKELLEILKVPESMLPEVKTSCGVFGKTKKEIFRTEIPVSGILGDQQASLFGQACFERGNAKNTYGTGCFALANTGREAVVSENRLLTTVAWNLDGNLEYALEGSVFIGGAVIQWLRDKLQVIDSAADSETAALSVEDSGGVYFVPAFVGLGAPYWEPDVKGTIVGITRGTTRAHITRAALESIAFQSRDLIDAIEADLNEKINDLKVDGGASLNSFLIQFQADILGISVTPSKIAETTALGAAYIAGLHCGYWNDKDEIVKNWQARKTFKPEIDTFDRERLVSNWSKAIEAARVY
jgi:glycerol kinase